MNDSMTNNAIPDGFSQDEWNTIENLRPKYKGVYGRYVDIDDTYVLIDDIRQISLRYETNAYSQKYSIWFHIGDNYICIVEIAKNRSLIERYLRFIISELDKGVNTLKNDNRFEKSTAQNT